LALALQITAFAKIKDLCPKVSCCFFFSIWL